MPEKQIRKITTSSEALVNLALAKFGRKVDRKYFWSQEQGLQGWDFQGDILIDNETF